jgi:purine-binding chemotaxis protein CheW
MSDVVLTFTLDGDVFGLPVAVVAEVIDPLPVTQVPYPPRLAPGLVNVRGVVAPLLDLRSRLGLSEGGGGDRARMLVLDVKLDGEDMKVVALADDVDTIAELSEGTIEPVPDLGTRWAKDAVRGIMRRSDDIIALLDIDRILSLELYQTAESRDGPRSRKDA